MYNTPRPGWAVFVSNRENIDCGLAIRVYVCMYVVYKIYKYLIRIRCFFSSLRFLLQILTPAASVHVRVCVCVYVCLSVFVCVWVRMWVWQWAWTCPPWVLGQTVVQTAANSTDTQRCVRVIVLTSSLTTPATPSSWQTLAWHYCCCSVVKAIVSPVVPAVVWQSHHHHHCHLGRGSIFNFINLIHAGCAEMSRTESAVNHA